MAEDRMRNDDRDINMGGGQQKDEFGKQTPGRKSQKDDLTDDDFSTGQRGGGQQQNEPGHFEDNFGNSGKSGGMGGRGSESGLGQSDQGDQGKGGQNF